MYIVLLLRMNKGCWCMQGRVFGITRMHVREIHAPGVPRHLTCAKEDVWKNRVFMIFIFYFSLLACSLKDFSKVYFIMAGIPPWTGCYTPGSQARELAA